MRKTNSTLFTTKVNNNRRPNNWKFQSHLPHTFHFFRVLLIFWN